MYAVIKAGGKQARVREGDVIEVERIRGGEEVAFVPVLIVDDDGVMMSDKDDLSKATVTGKVLGEHRGRKVDVFRYRNKTGYRKSQGHRQTYASVEITKIDGPGLKKSDKPAAKKAPAKKAPAKESAATKPEAADDKAATASETTAKKATATRKQSAAKPASEAGKKTTKTRSTKSTSKAAPAKAAAAKKKTTAKKSGEDK